MVIRLDPVMRLNAAEINFSTIVFLALIAAACLKLYLFARQSKTFHIAAYMLHLSALYLIGPLIHAVADGIAWVFLHGK